MNPPVTIPQCMVEAARRWPDRPAVIDGDGTTSFAGLAAQTMGAAAAFVAQGVQPADRVAIWAPNSLEWIVACLGLQAAGAVLVPINTRFRAVEAIDILQRSGAVLLIVTDGFHDRCYSDEIAGASLPALRSVVSLHGGGLSAFLATAGPQDRAIVAQRLADLGADSLSDIMFTSGTTGSSKGVVSDHGQTVASARAWSDAVALGEGDRFAILWPFFHCAGYKAGWLAALLRGAAVVPVAHYTRATLVDLVERHRVTVLPGPPTLFHDLLGDPLLDRARLSSVRVSVTGAATVPPQLIRDMRAELGIAMVMTGYGLTEVGGTVTMTRPEDPPEIVVRTCGRAVPGIGIRIVGEAGERLGSDRPGDIEVRGATVMRAYLDDPAATADAIDGDGWLRTGDVGSLDDAGYLTITDRKKHMYISGGFNCYPAEIEKLLLGHLAIAQVAVVGVADDRMGEVGKAYVVLRPDVAVTASDLLAWSRAQMAGFKAPRTIELRSALPVNATGKVEKFRLAS